MVFDIVLINVGFFYNQCDGVFIVFIVGVYVFYWVIYSQYQGDIIIELVVNLVSWGCSWLDSYILDEYYVFSGLVVLYVSQGDFVFVRMYFVWYSIGKVMSFDDYYRFFFSGWLLV